MNRQYKYWLWNSILPKEFCEQQIASVKWDEAKNGEIVENAKLIVNPEKRITDVFWLSSTSPIGCVAQIHANMANEMAGWNFALNACSDIQMGRYRGNVSGFYDWHNDAPFFVDAETNLVRKLSISILLDDPKNFEGGKFEFLGFEDKDQPVLGQGSIIAFPSILEHRVTPVTSGNRHSAVAWVSGPAYK